MGQVNEVLLNALHILHNLVLLGGDEFGPQVLHERLGEEPLSVFRVGLVEDLEVDGPKVALVGLDELGDHWDEALSPDDPVRAHKE